MKCVYTQPAYILYQRPFRDTSVLLEIFSQDYGRISLIARGARQNTQTSRKSKSNSFHGLLEPFNRLLISWKGRTDLLNLTQVESYYGTPPLHGKLLFYGWYLNELLYHTLKRFDPYPELFQTYTAALSNLFQYPEMSVLQFEKKLLSDLGYLPRFDQETQTGYPIAPSQWYSFSPDQGITVSSLESSVSGFGRFQGSVFLDLHSNQWHLKTDFSDIKRLLYITLNHLLLGRKLKSRDLLSVMH